MSWKRGFGDEFGESVWRVEFRTWNDHHLWLCPVRRLTYYNDD
jgi:hypothetical protein